MKKRVRLTESQFRSLVGKCVKRVLNENRRKRILNEGMAERDFQTELYNRFYREIFEMTKEIAVDYAKDGYEAYEDIFVDMADDYSDDVASIIVSDSMKVLKSNYWDIPKHNLYTLDFAMKENYNVFDFQGLLNLSDPVEAYVDWFWNSVGTYDVRYKFQEVLSEECYVIDHENEE